MLPPVHMSMTSTSSSHAACSDHTMCHTLLLSRVLYYNVRVLGQVKTKVTFCLHRQVFMKAYWLSVSWSFKALRGHVTLHSPLFLVCINTSIMCGGTWTVHEHLPTLSPSPFHPLSLPYTLHFPFYPSPALSFFSHLKWVGESWTFCKNFVIFSLPPPPSLSLILDRLPFYFFIYSFHPSSYILHFPPPLLHTPSSPPLFLPVSQALLSMQVSTVSVSLYHVSTTFRESSQHSMVRSTTCVCMSSLLCSPIFKVCR